ncbi:6-bladed beta-propeller [Bacteroidia bacterium]|nr:6-bladed beta-propeller [Bacteroidia bacterium]
MQNMKISIIFIVVSLLILGGCQQHKSKGIEDSGINIKARLENYQKEIVYSTLFDQVKYVKLEMSNESLIGIIAKIRVAEERIFILDQRLRTLLAFSDTGKFLWKINKIGNGPGEYTEIIDFDLKNDQLYLFDPNRNILEFDLSGNFIKSYPLKRFGTSMAVNDTFLYLYTCNYPTEEGKYQLLIMDDYGQNSKIGVSVIPKNLIEVCKSFNSENAFCHFEDETRFFTPFSTKIYSIKRDSIFVKYNIDFGEFNIPENYFDNYTADDVAKSKYAYGLNAYWETDAYFYFNIKVNENFQSVLYSKKEKKLTYGIFYDDLAFCFPSFSIVNNQFAVGFRSADDLHAEYDNSKEKRKDTLLEKVVSEITPDDNPVIFLYHFK